MPPLAERASMPQPLEGGPRNRHFLIWIHTAFQKHTGNHQGSLAPKTEHELTSDQGPQLCLCLFFSLSLSTSLLLSLSTHMHIHRQTHTLTHCDHPQQNVQVLANVGLSCQHMRATSNPMSVLNMPLLP